MLDQLTTYQKLLLLVKLKGGGGGGTLKTLTGNLPLTVSDALNHAIISLTRYGLCTQDGTATPDAPVDIVTNNGALRYGALGRNLIDPSAANTILGYYIAKLTGEIGASVANFIFAGYMPVEPGKTYVAYGRTKTGNDLSAYNRIAWYDRTKTWIAGADYTQNRIAVVTAPENAAYARFSCNPSGTTTQTVTQEIVDSYNWTFAEGTAEIIPFEPFVGGIYTDGMPETLTIVHNLYDANGVDPNHYYDANGVYTETQTTQLSNRVPVKRGDVIVCKTTTVGTGQATNIRYNQLNASGEWVSQEVQSQARNTTLKKTVTINQDGFFVFSGTMTGTTYVDFDATVITIESETQAASVPMLLGVGDYKDAAELINGIKTGKVGVYVFTGQETVTKGTNVFTVDNLLSFPAGGFTPFCTRYEGVIGTATIAADSDKMRMYVTTNQIRRIGFAAVRADYETGADLAAAWARWYAEGNPMILVYPLATETTEQTTPHNLVTHKGTNVVDSTANVSPVEAKIEYYGTEAPMLGMMPEPSAPEEPAEEPQDEPQEPNTEGA